MPRPSNGSTLYLLAIAHQSCFISSSLPGFLAATSSASEKSVSMLKSIHFELAKSLAVMSLPNSHGAYAALVSGGFSFFTGRVAALCGFDLHRSNVLLDDGAALNGLVAEPILDRDTKLATLTGLAAERGLPLAATLAVGDGANDLDMLRAAGLGVAFHAKPIVAAAAQARVDHGDLRALLFAQGYRAEELVGGGG